jgi:hypothetical protein
MNAIFCRPAFVSAVLAMAASVPLFTDPGRSAEPDQLEGPWGTVHADLSGTASSTEISWIFDTARVEEKWRLDIMGAGHDRPTDLSSITFDADGNLYWISGTGGGTGAPCPRNELLRRGSSGRIRPWMHELHEVRMTIRRRLSFSRARSRAPRG